MFIDVCLAEAAWIEEMAEPNKDNSEACNVAIATG